MDFADISDQITQFIKPELLVLIPVLFMIGAGLKRTQRISDRMIPALLGIIGILLAGMWVLGSTKISGWQQAVIGVFTAIIQGVLCTGASVYFHQLFKQACKKE